MSRMNVIVLVTLCLVVASKTYMMHKNDVEDSLKDKLHEDVKIQPDCMQNVLRKARRQQGIKDVLGVFLAGIWAVFVYFGAQAYVTIQQKRIMHQHTKRGEK